MKKFTRQQIEYLIQFAHPDKLMPWSSTVRDPRTQATLFGLSAADYRAIRQRLADEVLTGARELLQDADFARRVDNLPFARGSVVVGFGDSITDDLQSWIEILKALLAIRRPQDKIQIVNAGISGDTTSQMIARFLDVVNLKPDWIICMAGTNDARLHGRKPVKTLVSLAETAKNFAMLRNFARTQTKARMMWLTPAPVISSKIARHWLLGGGQMMWLNKDLSAIARVVRRQPGLVVDLQRVFGQPANPQLLLPDGLHPSFTGQKAIVKAVVERLSTKRNMKKGGRMKSHKNSAGTGR